MIIYVPNDDLAPIVGYLWRCANSANVQKPTPTEAAALERMLQQIDAEKKCKPYQMWLLNQGERNAADSVAGADSGVGAARPARRDRVRKGRQTNGRNRGKK